MPTTKTNTKTTLFSRRQPGGAFTFVNELITTGNVWFVDSGATTSGGTGSSFGRTPDAPFTTYAAAISAATTSNGDMIVLMPGHAETTSAIAHSKAGIKVLGLGYGGNRPTLTATTGATDLVDVTGANNMWENIIFVGAASGCTSLFSVAADDNTWKNCVFMHAATPVVSFIMTSGARSKWDGCRWLGTANGPTISIRFDPVATNGLKDCEIVNCIFNYAAYGLDTAAIAGGTDGLAEGIVIANNIFVGMDLCAVDFASSSAAACRGIITDNYASSHGAISIADIIDPSSLGMVWNQATDAIDADSPQMLPAATAT